MSLSVGTRLGPYEVVAPLGAGGMGEVYRARDARLGRDVAIKILPDVVAADPERKARFEREARTLASLNHPNVAGIHGVEDSQGIPALVLELVDGPTLADRLAQGSMPIDEALVAARQIADALEAAHDIGIIHRDLKPANIKLRPDGTVKVLDFGLAKAIGAARDGAGERSGLLGSDAVSHSPTLTGPFGMTGVGVLLGTAAYMPPEQARGKPVDKRADIWSFGCVLYEMLAGKRCFEGEDASLTLAEVMKSEPDWSALPPGTPTSVHLTLKQCLQKDPKRRIRDIGDVRLSLEGAFATPAAPVPDRSPGLRRSPRILAAVGAGGMVIGAAAAVALMVGSRGAPAPPPPVDRFTITLPAGTGFRDNIVVPMALANDGRRIVMNVSSGGKDRVLLRALDQIEAQPVPGLEGTVGSIFLSHDGQWVAYNDAKGSLKKMRLAGGPPATIAETGVVTGGWQGASWGSAGIIAFSTGANRGVMEVSEAGGDPKLRTQPEEGELHQFPHFLPDGRSLLFMVRRRGEPIKIAYLPAGAASYVPILDGSYPLYVPSGHLLFVREEAVWAVRFDGTTGRTIGDPIPVLEGVSTPGGNIARASVSADGTLAYVAGTTGSLRTIVRVDRQGREEALPGLPGNSYQMFRLSPDGARLAFTAGRPTDLWTYDFNRGTSVRVTNDEAIDRGPLWTQDGRRLVFSKAVRGRSELLVQNADGTGTAEPFLPPNSIKDNHDAEDWAADDKTLVVSLGRSGGPDIGAVNLDGEPRFRELISTPSIDVSPRVSPDGRWVAYQSDMSGVFEVYVERLPELGDRRPISTGGGTLPRWSSKGDELFYQSPDGRRVFSAPISPGPKLAAGAPVMLFEGSYVPVAPVVRLFEVTADGRFILAKSASVDQGGIASVVVVQNWIEELKRLLPAASRAN